MYAQAREEMGRIDVLFNNAGISPDDDVSVLDTSLEAWQRVQDVNLKSVFLCCKHGIPHLLDGGRRLGDQHRVVRRGDGRRHLADLLHGLEGRRARAVARARRGVRAGAASASTPSAPARSTRRCCRSSSRRIRRRPRAGSSTCRWAASPRPREIAQGALFLASDEQLLRDRLDLPGRRRPLRRLRHAGVSSERPSLADGGCPGRSAGFSRSRRGSGRRARGRAGSSRRSRARSPRAAPPGRRRSEPRPHRTGSRRSSARRSAAVTSAWNWMPQTRSPIR